MKKALFFVLLLPLFLCGTCGGDQSDNMLTPIQMDSLINKDIGLPKLVEQVPITTIDMDGIEDDPTPVTTTVKVETMPNNRQKITLYLPEIESGPHIGHLTLDVSIVADTVQSFKISAQSAKAVQQKAAVSSPAKNQSYGKIKTNDTRFSIAKRLGVPVGSVLNKEPLRVGEEIHIKQ